ncbi:MAG TPA: formyltransferase family protein [Sphingobacteriaceae bacterium]
MSLKIGILADKTLSDFRLKTIQPILQNVEFLVALAVVHNRTERTLKQKFADNIKRKRGAYILVLAISALFKGKPAGVKAIDFFRKNRVKTLETNSLYSSEVIERLKYEALDVLLLVCDAGIIKEPLLSVTRVGILSYHHGDMRKFRGLPPAFWELYNHEKKMGITVQILSPELDSGIPVEEKSIEIFCWDCPNTLVSRAFKESEDMMHNALIKLQSPEFVPQPLESFGPVYTFPRLSAWLYMYCKILARRIQYHFGYRSANLLTRRI